ncbi:Guanine deaminase (Guanase) (Guanine aminohydrolase) [Mucor velutinosus]|uniref:Guanine deaminase (Guanase) (Guanine aminohydrolase) n=1 Tax=Mucor velutinosus TaxID=708070 RepID=A0AAN7HY90_9FUNG|nr:Guanine deaminase (Guanase) (Guanine aminohydrolase) [Mucor velutinosus]
MACIKLKCFSESNTPKITVMGPARLTSMCLENGLWIQVQNKSIGILQEAKSTRSKGNLIFSRMLYITAPRLQLVYTKPYAEDIHVYVLVSFAIKSLLGCKILFKHHYCALNHHRDMDRNKFKPDNLYYVKIRSKRFDIYVTDIKSSKCSAPAPASDLVKIGQQNEQDDQQLGSTEGSLACGCWHIG